MIMGPGKYPDYNFYRVAGVAIAGKDTGEAGKRRASAGRQHSDAVR